MQSNRRHVTLLAAFLQHVQISGTTERQATDDVYVGHRFEVESLVFTYE